MSFFKRKSTIKVYTLTIILCFLISLIIVIDITYKKNIEIKNLKQENNKLNKELSNKEDELNKFTYQNKDLQQKLKKAEPWFSMNEDEKNKYKEQLEIKKAEEKKIKTEKSKTQFKKTFEQKNGQTKLTSIINDICIQSNATSIAEKDINVNTNSNEIEILIIFSSNYKNAYGVTHKIRENIDNILKECELEGYKFIMKISHGSGHAYIEEHTKENGWQQIIGGSSKEHIVKVIGEQYYNNHFNY